MYRYRLLRGTAVAAAALLVVAGGAVASQMALGPRDGGQSEPTAEASASGEPVESAAPSQAELQNLLQMNSPSPESETGDTAGTDATQSGAQQTESNDDHGDRAQASAGASAAESPSDQGHDGGGAGSGDHSGSGGTDD